MMRVVTVTSAENSYREGTIRWALQQSTKEPVIILFSHDLTIDFSNIYYESGDNSARRDRTLRLNEDCQGLEMIGPVTFIGITFDLERIDSPVRFENIRIRTVNRNYGKGVNIDCLYAEKCKELEFKKCSFSHSNDESVSLNKCEKVDFDRCVFGPPLHIPLTKSGEFVHKEGDKGSHGYLFRAGSCKEISMTRCVLTDAKKRVPQINNEGIKEDQHCNFFMRNCVVYNYGAGFTYNGKPDEGEENSTMTAMIQNNLFIPGPRTDRDSVREIDLESSGETKFHLKDVETNKVLYKNIRIRVDDNIQEIESGAGPTFDITELLSGRVGAMPNDLQDTNTCQQILQAINVEKPYDNLDSKNYYKNWNRSGWIN